jgi:tetratricopeptide (TPR) repeat protein
MSHSTFNRPKSSPKFVILSGMVVVAWATALAALWPYAHAYATWKSQQLVSQGRASQTIEEAATDFHLAAWLDPANKTAKFELGRTRLALGQPDRALVALNQAGEGSDTTRLKLRIYLEQQRHAQAVQAGQALVAIPNATDTDRILSCQAFILSGQAANCQALQALVTSSEARQSLSRIEADHLPAATELYVLGLPNSSERVLLKLPNSYERSYLLGRIQFDRHTGASLEQAVTHLTAAIEANPAAIEARQVLAATYRAQGKVQAATAQDALVAKLASGRP